MTKKTASLCRETNIRKDRVNPLPNPITDEDVQDMEAYREASLAMVAERDKRRAIIQAQLEEFDYQPKRQFGY